MPLIDASVTNQLNSVELSFLEAIRDGGPIDSITSILSSIQQTIESSRNLLCAGTLSLAYKVASNVSAIAKSFVELETLSNGISQGLDDELSSLFRDLSIHDRPKTSTAVSVRRTGRKRSQPRTQPDEGSRVSKRNRSGMNATPTKSYHQVLHQWLIQNIHNPYPTKAYKHSIAKEYGVSVQTVSDWFTQARKRIGWSAIRKEHFQGDAFTTAAYARSVLLPDSSTQSSARPLSGCFFKMKDAAKRLYATKFVESDLARSTMCRVETEILSKKHSTPARSRIRKSLSPPPSFALSPESMMTSHTHVGTQNCKWPRDTGVSLTSDIHGSGERYTRARAGTLTESECATEGPTTPIFSEQTEGLPNRFNRKRSLPEDEEEHTPCREEKRLRRSLPNRLSSIVSNTPSDTSESETYTPGPSTPYSTPQLILGPDTALPQTDLFSYGLNNPLHHTDLLNDINILKPPPNFGVPDPFDLTKLGLQQENETFPIFDIPPDSFQEILSSLDFSLPTGIDISEGVLGELEFTAANLDLGFLSSTEFLSGGIYP